MASSNRGGTIQVEAAGALTGDGGANSPLGVNVDGVTVIVNGANALQAPSGGGGTIGGDVGGTDNVLVRSDGIGGATIQGSTVTLSDAGALGSVGSLAIGVTAPHGASALAQLSEAGAAAITTGQDTLFLLAATNSAHYHLGLLNTTFSTDTADALQTYQYNDGSVEVDLGYGTSGLAGVYYTLDPTTSTFGLGGKLDVDVTFASVATLPAAEGGSLSYSIATFTATDGAITDQVCALGSHLTFGGDGAASLGIGYGLITTQVIEGSADAGNQFAGRFAVLRADIGTGYTQTTGPVGALWLDDDTILGSIGVQPARLIGHSVVGQNYYNGSPSESSSVLLALQTNPGIGGGMDPTHAAATSYPWDVGLWVGGASSGSANGFTTAIQVGGADVGGWDIAASKIGTGLKLLNCTTDIDSEGGVVLLKNLPTVDPAVAGQLWNSSGTLKVSAG